VQIAECVRGRRRIVAHVGSAYSEAELGLLLERAGELLRDTGQGEFSLGVEPTRTKTGLLAPAAPAELFAGPEPQAASSPVAGSRVVAIASRLLFDILAEVYADLGVLRRRRGHLPRSGHRSDRRARLGPGHRPRTDRPGPDPGQ
jgi:hypothetical protein